MADTLLFHDYETFGISPALDRPAQFAAIRTDLELNPIGEPFEIFCQPANDYVPTPGACLVTGITPQQAQRKGVSEAEFINQINQHFSEPGTCGVGYNSIRFDDEVTRYTLYRNFFDPYAREWQNGNSRWDLIDLARACYALRPEGIEWPIDDQGQVSFRLERLTEANDLSHQNAHDAVSDVRATIALAKLIKSAQPRLYDYYFNLRHKREVTKLFDLIHHKPLVHVSGMFGAAQGCVSWVAPVDWHPINNNAMMVIDLNQDITPLIELDSESIRTRLYTKRSELPSDALPIPVKLVHINKCPFLASAATLSAERGEALGLDRLQCRKSLEALKTHPEIRDKLIEVYSQARDFEASDNPDQALYNGFFTAADRANMERVRAADPVDLSKEHFQFDDERLNRMLFRYKARNFPYALTEDERLRWQAYRQSILPQAIEKSVVELESLAQQLGQDEHKLAILKQLYEYLSNL
jgi:exodeoxyribonuclease-1